MRFSVTAVCNCGSRCSVASSSKTNHTLCVLVCPWFINRSTNVSSHRLVSGKSRSRGWCFTLWAGRRGSQKDISFGMVNRNWKSLLGVGGDGWRLCLIWRRLKMPTLTDSVTPLQLSYYCLGYRLSAYRSCWGTKAYGSPNGTILLGYARARSNWKQIWPTLGSRTRSLLTKKRYTRGTRGKCRP